jgi:5-methylcytosine-specific restriction enzyme subunit McrC
VNEAPFVFNDLVGPEVPPNAEEDAWLAAIAAETNAADFTLQLAPSNASQDPEPILVRQLDGSWRAGRYVGEIRRSGRTLEIRPRLGVETIAAWAGAALNLRILPHAAEQRGTAVLIAELVAATWRASILDAARHGLPGLREDTPHIGPYVVGRLDVQATLRLRAGRKPLVASRPRPKQLNNPVTRSVAIADRVLNARLRRSDWRGERLEELMPRVHGAVGARPRLPSRRELDRVKYTPLTLAFRRAADLSWQIARRRGLRASATAERTDGILIDVAELWELFLVHCCRRAYGTASVSHTARGTDTRTLLRSRTDPSKRMGRLFPDILVGTTHAPSLILDAKYKPLSDPRGVDRDDLYQLAAYLAAHTTPPVPTGMLGYPAFDSRPASSRAERHGPWQVAFGHTALFRRLPVDEVQAVAALRHYAATQQTGTAGSIEVTNHGAD